MVIECLLDYVMLIPPQAFSHHLLSEREFIDIASLITTLNALRVLKYSNNYDISNTTCKLAPLKASVMSYYKNKGVCKDPIVVTDDDFCLDGRHRVAYRKQIGGTLCGAYIVPRQYVNKFIRKC